MILVLEAMEQRAGSLVPVILEPCCSMDVWLWSGVAKGLTGEGVSHPHLGAKDDPQCGGSPVCAFTMALPSAALIFKR